MPVILIADDEAVDLEMAIRCLQSIEDLSIESASDGKEALKFIAEEQPDLVLTDLRMPRMNGLELVEEIQAEFPLVPVVLMTSQGNERIAVKALHAGAASYVSKKDLKSDLSGIICQVLEIAKARRRRREVLQFLVRTESDFKILSDPTLITPLVGYLQDNLERCSFGGESTRTQVGMALMEALSNAIIHGNLEVDSNLRREDPTRFDALVKERQTQEPYSNRLVYCEERGDPDGFEYVIRDEGGGFDPKDLADPTSPENLFASSGRGIMLIRTFMDHVEFNELGNEIRMRMNHPEASS